MLDNWQRKLVSLISEANEMEYEEKSLKEEREKVLVPVRREEAIHEEKIMEEPAEKIWKMPRRWRAY